MTNTAVGVNYNVCECTDKSSWHNQIHSGQECNVCEKPITYERLTSDSKTNTNLTHKIKRHV